MHLSYSGVETAGNQIFYFQDIDELLETGLERRKKPIKFKQERIFPAQKKSRVQRRKNWLH